MLLKVKQIVKRLKKGSSVHVAPVYAGSEKGSEYFRSYIRNLSLHFCKMLFLELEHTT
jgi:hypothetical protein